LDFSGKVKLRRVLLESQALGPVEKPNWNAHLGGFRQSLSNGGIATSEFKKIAHLGTLKTLFQSSIWLDLKPF